MSVQPIISDAVHINPCAKNQVAVPASAYSYEELTSIYNQTRVDYIVPMPMNSKRMQEYVLSYDVDLSASVVSFYDKIVTGIGMLGLRDNRAWITRLGIIPNRRGRKNGSFLMDALLHQARAHHADLIQLEVISGNEPAYNLFVKYGFQEVRELSIIRHPPGLPESDNPLPDATITALSDEEIRDCLAKRPIGASWVEETMSILKKGRLYGYRLNMQNRESGWIVFSSNSFQMGNFVLDASSASYDEIILALLYHIRMEHGLKDTKIENVPTDNRLWQLFHQSGYVESFRRIEMILNLR